MAGAQTLAFTYNEEIDMVRRKLAALAALTLLSGFAGNAIAQQGISKDQ